LSDETHPDPTPVTGVRYGSVTVRDEIHFTGGLRALRASDGWRLGPIIEQGRLGWLSRPLQSAQLAPVTDHLGLMMIAGEETSDPDSMLPAWTWTPFDRPGVPLRTADTWSMIATSARMESDTPYADLALSIASTVRAGWAAAAQGSTGEVLTLSYWQHSMMERSRSSVFSNTTGCGAASGVSFRHSPNSPAPGITLRHSRRAELRLLQRSTP